MKLHALFIAGLALLIGTVCLNAQIGNGVFGGGQLDPPQRKPGQGAELINDLICICESRRLMTMAGSALFRCLPQISSPKSSCSIREPGTLGC